MKGFESYFKTLMRVYLLHRQYLGESMAVRLISPMKKTIFGVGR